MGPLFRPGAGSRSSLGRRIQGRASEVARGRFPLGGGNDEGGSAGVGAGGGEIPAASAGMTELGRGCGREVAPEWRVEVVRGLVLVTARYPRQARV